MKSVLLTLAVATSTLLAAEPAAPSDAKVVDLRVESQTNPTAVNTPLPRFSWRIETDKRTWLQESYEILVASSPELLAQDQGDLWASGKVAGGTSHFISFSGAPIPSGTTIHWKVRCSGHGENVSPWSEPALASFKLGDPDPAPSPLFPKTGTRLSSFSCSDANLNQIFAHALDRLHEISSQRDIGLTLRAAGYHTPLHPATDSWLLQTNRSINPLGYYPAKLPTDGSFATTQSDAAISGTHAFWWMTGDASAYQRFLGNMKRYVFARKDYDSIDPSLPFGTLPGDTLPAGDPTPASFIDDTTQALNLLLILDMGRFASTDPYDLQTMKQYQQSLPKAFASNHLLPNGAVKYNSLAAQLLALRSGLLTSTDEKELAKSTIIKLLSKPNTNPLAKFDSVSAQYLLRILTWIDELERAFSILKETRAGEKNAVELVLASEWLISMVAGIEAAEAGFKTIRLSPQIPAEETLSFAKASYDSPQGKISSHWYYKDGSLHLEVTIPPNTTALITLPCSKSQVIMERGAPIQDSPHQFSAITRNESDASFQIGSGTYHFTVGQ